MRRQALADVPWQLARQASSEPPPERAPVCCTGCAPAPVALSMRSHRTWLLEWGFAFLIHDDPQQIPLLRRRPDVVRGFGGENVEIDTVSALDKVDHGQ